MKKLILNFLLINLVFGFSWAYGLCNTAIFRVTFQHSGPSPSMPLVYIKDEINTIFEKAREQHNVTKENPMDREIWALPDKLSKGSERKFTLCFSPIRNTYNCENNAVFSIPGYSGNDKWTIDKHIDAHMERNDSSSFNKEEKLNCNTTNVTFTLDVLKH